MKKQFIIEVDIVEGSVDYKNPEKLSYLEVLGAIEFVKLMISNNFDHEVAE
ncbi:hypothetical protein [Paenibacillus lactis]|uniref:Uncharacterized protein n=1 Tax=Paenibacillus lactis 154 TaxID=743719 RepID=G4HNU7_9BACL|nr:hypothetical protein [Paenibacillus lactis]EHB50111.1 hypothetical protein PaelaDRAFT_5658 [Paenibacillus lactis 154]